MNAPNSVDYDSLARKHGGLPVVDYDTLAQKFGGQLLENRPVHHTSNDVEELRASAERQAPKIGDAVAAATASVPGAKVEAVRDSKDSDRITDKAERQGVQPNQIADIAAAKVTAPDQKSAEKVLENLHGKMPVDKSEGEVSGEPGKNAVRQVQAVVDTKAPNHEPIKKAEVLIQTPEMHAATEDTHDDYRKAQELRAAGKEAEASALETKIAGKHEAAEVDAQRRINNAKGTDSAQEKAGRDGSSRSSGKEGSDSSSDSSGQKEKARAPIPPVKLAELQSKLSTSAAVPPRAPKPPDSDSLKGQSVEVRDANGNWKSGKVLSDSVTTGNTVLRRLRGVFDDGSKFDNVKLQDVRKGDSNGRGAEAKSLAVSGKEITGANSPGAKIGGQEYDGGSQGATGPPQHPDVAVDFDGTLAKETGGERLGEPLPERVNSIKKMLADGKSVVIFTRRVENDPSGREALRIQDWLEKAGLPRLPVSAVKDATEFYDNNAHHAPTDANTPLIKSNNARKA